VRYSQLKQRILILRKFGYVRSPKDSVGFYRKRWELDGYNFNHAIEAFFIVRTELNHFIRHLNRMEVEANDYIWTMIVTGGHGN
jgi:hypothetical protein